MATQLPSSGRPSRAKSGPAVPRHGEPGITQALSRGRPRSEKAHKAILEAAAELLLARGLSA